MKRAPYEKHYSRERARNLVRRAKPPEGTSAPEIAGPGNRGTRKASCPNRYLSHKGFRQLTMLTSPCAGAEGGA